jgi:hypothetical protein
LFMRLPNASSTPKRTSNAVAFTAPTAPSPPSSPSASQRSRSSAGSDP